MPKRLLITGYGGFVAGSVVQESIGEWDVTAISRSVVENGPGDVAVHRLDLREAERVRQIFEDLRPDAVIHAAAMARIDYCEAHPDEAEAVNVGVTRQLVELCRQYEARMVFCSTDNVFDGQRGMYTENDPPSPINVYGQTKARAEQIVQEGLHDMVIARLALVMGFFSIGGGNSFLARLIADFERRQPVEGFENEVRTPIDVLTLGRALLELAGSDYTGVLHLAGDTRLNRYEMAQRIAGRLGYSTSLVSASDSNAIPGRAPRPNDASLDNAKARQVLTTPMRSLEDGLELVLGRPTSRGV